MLARYPVPSTADVGPHVWGTDGLSDVISDPHGHGFLEHVQHEVPPLIVILHAVAHHDLNKELYRREGV